MADHLVNETRAAASDVTAAPPSVSVADEVKLASASLSKWQKRTNGIWIARKEEDELRRWVEQAPSEESEKALLVVGVPGTGKSALLASATEALTAGGIPVLGIKADFIPTSVSSLDELATHLGLSKSVEATLSSLVDVFGAATVLIDQLDALCELVDNRTSRLEVLIELMVRAEGMAGVKVIASVRHFELRHEARLRRLAARILEIFPFSRNEALQLFPDVNFPEHPEPSLLTPHALDLIAELKERTDGAFLLPTSAGQLRERFWEAAIGHDEILESAAIGLARRFAERGALWLPRGEAGVAKAQLDTLIDRGLVREVRGGLVGFRHQTILEQARARELSTPDAVVAFATSTSGFESRPRFRAALLHMRSTELQDYQRAISLLWDADLRLHLRLLLIETVLEPDAPSSGESNLIVDAVELVSTRRSALAGLASKERWMRALREQVEGWIADFPAESLLLAISMNRHATTEMLPILEKRARSLPAGARWVLEVLARSDRVDARAEPLLNSLVPEIVSSSLVVLPPLVESIKKVDLAWAARLVISVALHERQCLEEGKRINSQGTVSELAELALPHGQLVPLVEEALLKLGDEAIRAPLDHEESLEAALQQLLYKFAAEDAPGFFAHAQSLPASSPLEEIYLPVLVQSAKQAEDVVGWLVAHESRLKHEPESFRLLDALAPHLDRELADKLDTAIDRVNRHELAPGAEKRWRFVRGRRNRAYRLALRDRIPEDLRSAQRLRHDESEHHQFVGQEYVPNPGMQGGIVQSPVSAAQLALASNEAVLGALAIQERPFKISVRGVPVGGGAQVLSEVEKLAKGDPTRVAEIVRALQDAGRLVQARQLLPVVAQHHTDVPWVESLVTSLMTFDRTLDVDGDCARAFRNLACRAGLSATAREAILRRLKDAPALLANEEDSLLEEVQFETTFAVFPPDRGGTIPRGAYTWLDALAEHYCFSGKSEHAEWDEAVRAALSADKRSVTWNLITDTWMENWRFFSGDHAIALLEAIRSNVANGLANFALARSALYWSVLQKSDSALAPWADWLVERRCFTAAAEFTVALATQPAPPQWADPMLAGWLSSPEANFYARGVVAACRERLIDHSAAASRILVPWLQHAASEDLSLLLRDTYALDGWLVGLPLRDVLFALGKQLPRMEVGALSGLTRLLERFLHRFPQLVLQLLEEVLSRCLEDASSSAQMPIADCLALSFSLRLRLPKEEARIQALFERALAADVPAAQEVLVTADGGNTLRHWHPGRYLRAGRPHRGRRRRVRFGPGSPASQ